MYEEDLLYLKSRAMANPALMPPYFANNLADQLERNYRLGLHGKS